jgi:prepilin-type N-terminal cleavage/methylation domain-containing protein
MRTHGGFSLIELLVVIAIILTLAGILFPVLASARRAGQRVVCLNNLRTLHAAFILYADDHEEQFPSTGNNFLWQGRLWRAALDSYVSTKSCYWCPMDSTSRLKYDSTSYAYLQTFYHKPEDIVPATAGGYYTCTARAEAQTLADVKHPAQKILIYEWFTNHEQPQRTMWDPTGPHMAVFVDGHAMLLHEENLNLNALGTRDPNWTVGGVGGKDVE